MYYKCHKINPNRGGSYINSLDWIKNKNAITNPISKRDNKGFKYTATVAVNHEEIENILKEQQKLNFGTLSVTGKEHQKKVTGQKLRKIM